VNPTHDGTTFVVLSGLAGQISRIRKQLHLYPRNELAWLELARLQCLTGHPENGRKAVATALGLNSSYRGVVRAAARFYLHVGEAEHALAIVRNAPGLRHDPWLAAAEISIASLLDLPARGIRRSRELLESGSFSPSHTSELGAALGTEFLEAGTDKLARRFFRHSLIAPNENSLAQGVWAEQWPPDLVSRHSPTLGGEAGLRQAILASEFDRVVELCSQWIRDEPYSSAPPVNGSFFSTVFLEDHQRSLAFVERGLISSPVPTI
jgi:hypothetical protein